MINNNNSSNKNQLYIITIYDITLAYNNTIERITDHEHLKSCLDRIIEEFHINPTEPVYYEEQNHYTFCCNKAEFCEDGYLVKSTFVCTSNTYINY